MSSGLHKRLGHTCLWVFECLLWRHRSAVTCRGDRGSGCSRPGRHSVWHKSSWRRSPLAPPESSRADDRQAEEQLYQRCFHTAAKVLGPTIDFPAWGFSRGTETPQGIWIQKFHRTGETDSWRSQQNPVCTRSQEKGAVTSQETESDLSVSVLESPEEAWVDSGLLRG